MRKRKLLIIAILFIIAIFLIPLVLFLANLIYMEANSYETQSDDCIMGCMPTFEKEVVWSAVTWANLDTRENGVPRGDQIIYVKNISTGEKLIVNLEPGPVRSLGKYKDKVVWVDNRKGHLQNGHWTEDWTMYLKDISTGKEIELMPSSAERIDVYKDKIVFREGLNLYVYDLNAKTKVLVDTNIGTCIDIDDYKIIYTRLLCEPSNSSKCKAKYDFELHQYNTFSLLNDSAGIYIYDSVKNTTMQIATVKYPSDIFCPSIFKNEVAYRNEDMIYLYDILGNTTTALDKQEPLYTGKGEGYLRLREGVLKYYQIITVLIGPDMFSTKEKCVQISLKSKKTKDITCKGGIEWGGLRDSSIDIQ